MNEIRIPFNRAYFSGREFEYMKDALLRGHVSGDGPYTKKCRRILEEALGAAALITTSGTHALEMTALLLNLGPGDEVIVPSFTFVSTANAYALRGCRLVFADSREDTFNLDESGLESLITPRTRAVVVVHYGGVGCEMDEISRTAAERGVAVVEDNAHGLFGTYRGRALGAMGVMSALSFHETKNFTCGEGGAVIINDASLVERAEIIREKGTDRSKFFRGQVDKYTWVDVGSSYLPSDLLGGFLLAQLEAREEIQARRKRLWESYRGELAKWAQDHGVKFQAVPPDCGISYHLFALLMPDENARNGLLTHLRERGILATFHYLPLHLSRMGLQYGGRAGDCPIAEKISARLLRLPFYTGMSDEERAEVLESVQSFRP